jgi:ABC-type multidrug transport system fused ATPase/permease subunit
MGDFLGKFAEEILSIFKRNYKRPKLWIGIICIGAVFILLIPYIDANFFYYNRMEKRVAILEQVMNLDINKIKSNDVFNAEYQALLDEMSQNKERSINTAINKMINYLTGLYNSKSEGNEVLKFITGALWLIFILICIPFMNTFNKRSDKLLAFIIIAILTCIVGIIFMKIPIIITPMVNYIGIPAVQFVIIILLIIKSRKNNNKKE